MSHKESDYMLVDYKRGEETITLTLRHYAWKRVMCFLELHEKDFSWWEKIGVTVNELYREILIATKNTLCVFGKQSGGIGDEMEYEVEVATTGRVQQFLLAHPDFEKLL